VAISQGVEADIRTVLAWLRAQYAGGRAPVYSPLHVCREALGQDGQCDPASWSRLWNVLPTMLERGLIEEAPLPQGDAGIRLSQLGARES
jgi:hypothetical protein